MLDFLRGTLPWGKFWRLVDRLGDGTHYRRAQQNDPETARYIAEAEAAEAEAAEKAGLPPPPPWRPDPDDWTLLHELTAQTRDRLGELATLIADLPTPVKTRSKPPAQFARPETLLDIERRLIAERREKSEVDRLMDLGERAKQRWRDQQAATG